MKTLICAAIMAAFCFASAAFAQQQHPCGPQDDVAKVLASQYDEHPVEAGAANGALVVLFASNGGATWSLVAMLPNGMACLEASGEGWQAHPAVPEPSKDKPS